MEWRHRPRHGRDHPARQLALVVPPAILNEGSARHRALVVPVTPDFVVTRRDRLDNGTGGAT